MIDITTNANEVTVRLHGELDAASSLPVHNLSRILGDTDCLVLDLADVTFIDSTGISTLAQLLRPHSNDDPFPRIICAEGSIRRLITLTGLDRLATVEFADTPSSHNSRAD